MASDSNPEELLCPSAQPDIAAGVVIGVVSGTPQDPILSYLREPMAVSTEVLSLALPAKPTEVFRLAAPCAEHACQHFDGHRCQLATRIVSLLEPVTSELPSCHLRSKCRWWSQEGALACKRCPQIVTEMYGATPQQRSAADPSR